uniref:hypothetical protein n=1 Tax=Streptomyces virginiae TaxID=1961 RepID=UPI002F90A4F9
MLVPLLSLGIFSWVPFVWSAVRQHSLSDAVLAGVCFVAVVCTMAYSYGGGSGVVIWAVLLTLMLGGGVLAGVRTPRTENVRTHGKPAAVWLITVLAVVYYVTASALAPSEPPTRDKPTPPAASPAPSQHSEPGPAVGVTESITTPDVPEATKADEPETPSTAEEETDDDGARDQDLHGQVGIQFGQACSPVGALAITEDGRPAKCFMGRDGRARWGYGSNRG